MAQGAIKIWMGLGAVLATAGAADAQTATHAHGSPPAHAAHAGQGGEGGEGGEGDAFVGLSESQALAGRLLLIRGHLMVGKELYDSGRADEALQHFMHPAEELWDSVEAPMKKKGLGKLEGALVSLSNAVKTKKPKDEVARLQAKVEQGIAKGMPVIKQPASAYTITMAVLQSAASEYKEAVVDGKLANVVEYQDGRGFMMALGQFLAGQEKAMKTKSAEGYAALSKDLAELRKNWPSATTPDKPVMEPGVVQALVSRAELHKGRFE